MDAATFAQGMAADWPRLHRRLGLQQPAPPKVDAPIRNASLSWGDCDYLANAAQIMNFPSRQRPKPPQANQDLSRSGNRAKLYQKTLTPSSERHFLPLPFVVFLQIRREGGIRCLHECQETQPAADIDLQNASACIRL